MHDSHKALAHRLREQLAHYRVRLKHGHALDVVAALHGLPHWNALAAQSTTPPLTGKAWDRALSRCLQRHGVAQDIIEAVAAEVASQPGAPRPSLLLQPDVQWVDTWQDLYGTRVQLLLPPPGEIQPLMTSDGGVEERISLLASVWPHSLTLRQRALYVQRYWDLVCEMSFRHDQRLADFVIRIEKSARLFRALFSPSACAAPLRLLVEGERQAAACTAVEWLDWDADLQPEVLTMLDHWQDAQRLLELSSEAHVSALSPSALRTSY